MFRAASLSAALASLLLLSACNRQQPAEQPTPPTTPDRSGRPGPDLTTLSDSTVVNILTKYGQEHPENEVLIKTRLGNMRVHLYDDTPLHRANFLLLANKGYFDETEFYRIEKDFVAQGGNSDHRTIILYKYRLPPEIRPQHIHKRGALAMARYGDEQNPEQLSSSHDFYLIQGKQLTPEQAQAASPVKLTPEQLQTYATTGGAPGLDGQYTVFGEVVEGLDVLKKLTDEPAAVDKWPVQPIEIKMDVLK